MSTTKKAITFLLLTFVISWAALIIPWLNGLRDLGAGSIGPLIFLFGPSIAAVVCSLRFEKGRRLEALGLRFRPNRWWLWALLIPFGLTALALLLIALFSPHHLAGIEEAARQYAARQHQVYTDAPATLLKAAGGIGLAILGNVIVWTVTEELGWRGYLYHLWRRFGFWRSSLAIGIVWGVWHWPMILLFGLNYPDHRALGLALMPIYAMLSATIMTLVRDKGGSVLAAGILHGTTNALVVVTLVLVQAPEFPWATPGMGEFGALALAALLIAWLGRGRPDLQTVIPAKAGIQGIDPE